MKRWVPALLLTALVAGLAPGPVRVAAAADAPPAPKILLDGLPLEFQVPPTIVDNRTMVPFRVIAEALGVNVTWHGDERAIDADGLGQSVRLVINQKTMWVNSVPVTLDVPPQIVNDRTLVPLRAFSTAFQAKVDWDAANRTAILVSPVRPMRTMAFYAISSYAERQYVSRFSDVAYGWATLAADGSVDLVNGEYRWPQPDGDVTGERLLADARAAGAKRHLMIQMRDGKNDLTNLVLDNARIDKAAASIAAVAAAKGFDGVVLDCEGLGLTEQGEALVKIQQGFTKLVTAVAAKLHANKQELIVSVPPLNGWYHGYDYKGIAAQADLLQVMAHDYRQDGNPEPADQVEEAIRLALQQVSRDKLMLGILAGIETPETLPQKAGLAKRYSLAGLSMWRLGQIGDKRMASLESSVTARK